MEESWASWVQPSGPAMKNGKPIKPSNRAKLSESIVTIGFSKSSQSIDARMERYKRFAHRVIASVRLA